MSKFGMVAGCALLALLCLTQNANALANEGVSRLSVGDLEIMGIADRVAPMGLEDGKRLIPELDKHLEYLPLFERGDLQAITQLFFFKDGEHRVLVDSGWGQDGKEKGKLPEILGAEGIRPEDITDIIITHMDFDHIGGLLHDGKAVFPRAAIWISAPEYEAWKNGTIRARNEFALNLARKVIDAYKDRLRIFNYGEEILPGITALDARGHTPGHTAFEIKSGQDKFIIAGDLMHLAPVQLPLPGLSSVYDMDKDQAASTRKKILEQAAEEGAILGGMHFPMLSRVLKRDDGGYMMREPR